MNDSTYGEMTHFDVIMVKLEIDEGIDGLVYTTTIEPGGADTRESQPFRQTIRDGLNWTMPKIYR